jgi:hypothetical protein
MNICVRDQNNWCQFFVPFRNVPLKTQNKEFAPRIPKYFFQHLLGGVSCNLVKRHLCSPGAAEVFFSTQPTYNNSIERAFCRYAAAAPVQAVDNYKHSYKSQATERLVDCYYSHVN